MRRRFPDANLSLIADTAPDLPVNMAEEGTVLVWLSLDAAATQPFTRHVRFAETALIDDVIEREAWRVFASGQVLPPAGRAINHGEYPFLETHPFAAAAPRGQGDLDFACFHFFPYGYLYRLIGLGPVNAFGHRIAEDYRALAERSVDTCLIVCFGGSAVWGTTVLYEQSFPYLLQNHLETLGSAGRYRSFRVLNFGVPGATVLNSMQQFLLFSAQLRPNYVVCHDGVNDLFYGCTADPGLVEEAGIIYQQQMEHWAGFLHQPGYQQNPNLGGPISAPTDLPPVQILKAYVRRKREFMTVARAFGARFIWATQPFAWSKGALSPLEKDCIRDKSGDPISYLQEFQTVRAMFDLLRPQLPRIGADLTIDFDALFGNYHEESTLMADMVHLAPEGESILALAYRDLINEDIKGISAQGGEA